MRENEKYVDSISGHLAQLTNAWQEMWANAANREFINFFIDGAKAVVNFANAIGVLPATLGLILPYIEIITRAKSGKGIVSSFLEWANGLNEAKKAVKGMAEAQEGLNVIEETATAINTAKTVSEEAKTAATIEATGAELAESAVDATGVASSTAKTVSNEAETLSVEEQAIAYTQLGAAEEMEQVAESGGIFAKASGGINLLKGAFTGLVSTIGAVPLAIGAAAVVLFAAKKAYDAHRESVFADAKATAENIKTQQEATSQQIESYKQLKAQLDSGDLSEQETISVKQQILDIQKSITEQYGTAAQSVDLINGKLEEQVGLLNSISQKEAQDQYFKDYEGFQVAKQEYNKNNRSYNIGLNNTGNANLDKAITDELLKNGFRIQAAGMGTFNASVKGTASDGVNALENTKKALEELKAEYRDRDTLEVLNKQIAKIEEQIGKAYEVVDKYEATALKGLELDLAGNDTKGYDIYKNYQSSVSNLEDAYISGDTQKINEARKAFDEANQAKNDFLKIERNEQFTLLFDKIDTSLIDTKNRFRDTVELFKNIPQPKEQEGLFEGTDKKTLKDNAKAQSNLTKEQKKAYKAAEKLYKLNPDKVDIKATLDNNTYASGKYADALDTLMKEMGWTTVDADEMINALVTAGIVHGDASDIAYTASDSYNVFSSSVKEAVTSLNSLNTALSESAKGTGITEQTLTELRTAFGDNLDSALERTANGYHLNTEGAYLLRQQQEAMVNADYASAMYEQYQALDKLQEGYLKAKEAGEDTSGFVQQRQAIQDNIDKLNEQLMTFNNANSAYQTWLAKQSSEGEREMYNSVYSGYDAVKDELERGWAGEKTRSWLDLIFNDENDDSFDAWTSSAEEVKEKFDEVTKDIEGTGGYSIADFFTVDANGKSTSQGVWNFFEAIENKQKEVGKEFVNLEEGWFDFTQNGDYQIADMLGMDIESVHSILRAAADAGFEIHLDQPLYSLTQLEEKAESAKKALEETTGTKLKINLDPQSEGEVDDAMQKLTQYQQTLAEDTSIDPEVKTERLQQVADLLNYMTAKKREFVEGKLFDFKVFDSKELETSKKNINDIVNRLSSYSKESGKTEFSEQFSIDPMLLNNVDYLQSKMDALKEIQPNVDDTQVQYLDQLLAQLQYRINILNGSNIGETVTVDQLMAAEQIVGDINTKLDYAAQHKDIEFNWDTDEEFKEELNTIASLPEEVKQKWGLEPDATGEELLELAKKGELHINVEATGNVPKDPVQTTQSESKTVTETTNSYLNQYFDTIDLGQETREKAKKESEEFDGSRATAIFDANYSSFAQTEKEVENKINEVDGMNASPSVTLEGLGGVINVAESMKSTISSIQGKTVDVVVNATSNGLSSLKEKVQGAINKINELNGKSVHFVNGTAHAYGTVFSRGSAYASGKWGLPKNQTALTGELGTEIVVRDGNWFTVGDDGAEFVNLQKGDIVFNHKQSEELLENGYVTSNKGRGHLVGFANGTAYSHGTSTGAIRPTTSSKNMAGSTTKSSSSSRSSNGNGNSNRSSNRNNNSNNNNNKNTNKDTKETKNTLDEIEILLSRVQRRIDRLQHTIDATYNIWGNRNNAIITQLTNVSKAIKANEKAYKKYNSKANKISLPEKWKKRVRQNVEEPGKKWTEYEIRTIKNQGIWDKIQEYQQLYEKALSAKDAVLDLKDQEAELYKQRFDNTKTSYEEIIDGFQHTIDLSETLNDTLSEAGKFNSKELIQKQITAENNRIKKLNEEYKQLVNLRNKAVKSGKIKKESEAWYEMQSAINEVESSIKEANKNLITYNNSIRQIDWDVWEKTHDAIGGVINELEFLYGLINEDKMFDEQGTITNEGVAGFAILAHEYDTYFRQVQEYQNEIDNTQKALNNDKYNQDLVDKLKELKEAQQDAASNAKKMKDAMVDVTEKGIKKQIDYVKKLIDDYEELLDTQKDQIDYAKKVSDQQKEINKLEKQYRAIQNDTSEEGATKRQQLKGQIDEKKEALKDTQEDRRITETKDMLSKFEESFEDFLNKKLEDIEGIVREVVDATNNSKDVISTTLTDLATSYGYTISDTLQSSIDKMDNNLVSYFSNKGDFEDTKVTSIAEGVDTIVKYFTNAQKQSEPSTAASTASKTAAKTTSKATSTASKSTTPTVAEAKTNVKVMQEIVEEAEHALTVAQDNLKAAEKKKNKEAINNALKGVSNASVKLNTANQNLAKATETLAKAESATQTKANTKTSASKSKANTTTATKSVTPTAQKAAQDKAKVEAAKAKAEAANMAAKIKQSGTHIQSYKNSAGKTVQGYFKDDGTLNASYTGWAKKGNKMYRFEKGKLVSNKWITVSGKKYYIGKDGARVTGKQTINKTKYTFDSNGVYKKKGWKKGTASVPKTDLAWTNEGRKAEAIIRKSDGAILTPLSKGDSVIPSSAMKNMYRALIDPEKYLKQYTTPDIKIVQTKESGNSSPATINMQFIANGVQDANKFANDLMNNKKIEKWIQEITLGQANGNNSYRKYNYAIR